MCASSLAAADAETGATEEVPTQPPPSSAESAVGEAEAQQESKQQAAAALPDGEKEEEEVGSSTITVEELVPATANIANALVCLFCLCTCTRVR